MIFLLFFFFFFFNDTATTEIYTLSLHDALPIYRDPVPREAAERVVVGRHLADEHVVRGHPVHVRYAHHQDRAVRERARKRELGRVGAQWASEEPEPGARGEAGARDRSRPLHGEQDGAVP